MMAAEIPTPMSAARTGSPAPIRVPSITNSVTAATTSPTISPTPSSESRERRRSCDTSTRMLGLSEAALSLVRASATPVRSAVSTSVMGVSKRTVPIAVAPSEDTTRNSAAAAIRDWAGAIFAACVSSSACPSSSAVSAASSSAVPEAMSLRPDSINHQARAISSLPAVISALPAATCCRPAFTSASCARRAANCSAGAASP
ncbi:unannotated protein [freshwater metagenome]|uniref:Unannotated protein n=1 Tax=freshwater metagenome TaxID=449393 RepID=A0A6J6GGA8_9ZZZZ